ncbi:hypothetical protein U0C82_05940 [Fulvimarina sp. 2208YS6-2-32]|uniref:NrtR DNA-binding winged helix domain-containing protein n=1 Tax=Fulvimarina uroteuthidis TaxID=3098149 RepID=A0ABU5HZY5_9HYPH|nr:hypothetical protein [Fulvimarina sp. 2208YS6-2-32]MDY8108694.1 hypothetical protein [Fulvimarina sp. 2208YS6-2-32]
MSKVEAAEWTMGAHAHGQTVGVGLNAVVIAFDEAGPRVLLANAGEDGVSSLPSGPLEAEHRTLESGVRSWVERQTGQPLGFVEQLYTFGDKSRPGTRRFVSIAYLALVRGTAEERPAAGWADLYVHFPYEDWREGPPQAACELRAALARWTLDAAPAVRRSRLERVEAAFGREGARWNEERVLERYELLYEAGLVAESARDRGVGEADHDIRGPGAAGEPGANPASGWPLALDHRRMLATAIGRLRAKIKYRPVLFELMPDEFTLFDLQRIAEALSGVRLHKPNFRRLMESQGLIEETGRLSVHTGGRPAKLFRYRPEITMERPGKDE